MSSILDEVRARATVSPKPAAKPGEPSAELPAESNTPEHTSGEVSPDADAATLKAEKPPTGPEAVRLIRRLLPTECSMLDLKRELNVSAEDCQRIEASSLKRNRYGREDSPAYFRAIELAKFIDVSGIDWERSAVSHARETLRLEDLFDASVYYPGHLLPADLGTSENNVCYALGIEYVGNNSLPYQVTGGMIVAGLKTLREKGVNYFVSGEIVQSALDRLSRQKAKPPVHEPDVITSAILSLRERERAEAEERQLTLEARYGELVRKGDGLLNSELEELGRLSVELNFSEAHYRRCLEVMKQVEHLKAVDTDEHRQELNAQMTREIEAYKELSRLENDLPKQISCKRGEINSIRDQIRESATASNEIARLQETFAYLFCEVSTDNLDACD